MSIFLAYIRPDTLMKWTFAELPRQVDFRLCQFPYICKSLQTISLPICKF